MIQIQESSFVKDNGRLKIAFEKGANLSIVIWGTKANARALQLTTDEAVKLSSWFRENYEPEHRDMINRYVDIMKADIERMSDLTNIIRECREHVVNLMSSAQKNLEGGKNSELELKANIELSKGLLDRLEFVDE